MKNTDCFSFEQIIHEVTGKEEHLKTCKRCRNLFNATRRIDNVFSKEKNKMKRFLNTLRKERNTIDEAMPILSSLSENERLAWIEKMKSASPGLAVEIARKAMERIYVSPLQAGQWLDLAESTLEAAKRYEGRFQSNDLLLSSARILTIKGSVTLRRGFIREAHRCYREAGNIYRQAGDEYMEALVAEGLTVTLTKTGRPDEARKLCLRTFPILRRYNAKRHYLRLMSNLTLVLYLSGKKERAYRIMHTLEKITTTDKEFKSNLMRNQVLTHIDEGKLNHAKDIASRLLTICKNNNLYYETARTKWLLGVIEMENNNYHIAEQLFKQAKDIFITNEDALNYHMTNTFIAYIRLLEGNCKESIAILQRAIDFLRKEMVYPHLIGVLELWERATVAEHDEAIKVAENAVLQIKGYDSLLAPHEEASEQKNLPYH